MNDETERGRRNESHGYGDRAGNEARGYEDRDDNESRGYGGRAEYEEARGYGDRAGNEARGYEDRAEEKSCGAYSRAAAGMCGNFSHADDMTSLGRQLPVGLTYGQLAQN